MNILIVLIYVLTGALFLWSIFIVVKKKDKNIFPGLQAQFFIITVVSLIFCLFKIYQQFAAPDLVKVINQFEGVFFLVAAVNLTYIIKIIWDTNKGRDVMSKGNLTIVIFLLFIEFIVIGSSWTALYFYQKSESVLLQQTDQYLNAVAASRASHIATIVQDSKAIVSAYASNLVIIECLQDIAIGKACDTSSLSKILSKGMEQNPIAYLGVILDKNGIVIGSTDSAILGQDWSEKEEFLNHNQNGYFSNIFPGESGEEYSQGRLILSVPVIENGYFLGVLSAHIRPDEFYAALLDRTNLGDTGEAILVDADETALSPRRFSDKILAKIDNPNALACKDDFSKYVKETSTILTVSKHDTSIVEFNNEFGRSILGAHAVVQGPTKGLKWCVLVEMGKQEALESLNRNLLEAAILSLIVIIIFTSVFVFVFDFFFRDLLKSSYK
jgi:hypothetical protein